MQCVVTTMLAACLSGDGGSSLTETSASNVKISYPVPEFTPDDRRAFKIGYAGIAREELFQINQWNRSRISFLYTYPGHVLRSWVDDLTEDQLRHLRFFKSRPITNMKYGWANSPIGRIQYAILDSGDSACFAFNHVWGLSGDDRRYRNRLLGYQCRIGRRWSPEDVSGRLARLGIAGVGQPSPGVLSDIPPDYIPPPADAASVAPEQTGDVPVVVDWQGVGREDAVMAYAQFGRTGSFRIQVDSGDCEGHWQWVSGRFDGAEKPNGTWILTCDNGSRAKGTYRMTAPFVGLADGTDDRGRKIKIFLDGGTDEET